MSYLCLKDVFQKNLDDLQKIRYNLEAINKLSDMCFADVELSSEQFKLIMKFLSSAVYENTYKLRHYLMDYELLFAEKD